MLGAFLGDHLGEPDQPVLGGDVGRLEHRGLLGVHRAHVDDAAAGALLVHLAHRRARGQEGAVEMDAQEPLPVGELEVLDRGDDLDAGIAHQHIDLAEMLDRLGDAGIDRVLAGHVHDHAQRLARSAELGGDRVGGGLIDVGDDDLAALAHVGLGNLLADAAGGAGDDGNFVLHTHELILDGWLERRREETEGEVQRR